MGQIGLADIQPVGGVLASGQLQDVGDEGRHTQTEDVDACEQSTISSSGGETFNHLRGGCFTYESNGSADVGVEVAASGIDVGLRLCAQGPPGEVAVEDGLPDQNLSTPDQSKVT